MSTATMMPGLRTAKAEALFASDLQSADLREDGRSTDDRVRAAVVQAVRRHGPRGCAAIVAHEFGEHPENAAWRMCWVIDAVRTVYPTGD